MAGAELTVLSGCGDCFHMMSPPKPMITWMMIRTKLIIKVLSYVGVWRQLSWKLYWPVNGSLAVTDRKFPCSPVSATSSIQWHRGITHRARNDLWRWKVVSETEWNGK